MLEYFQVRRFALLPMILALTIFAVGVAGFVATAGAPEHSQPATVLPDVVLAMPASGRVGLASPVATAEPAPENSPVVAVLATAPEPSTPVAAGAPASSSLVVAASEGTSARAMQGAALSPTATAAAENSPVYSTLVQDGTLTQAAAGASPPATPAPRVGKQTALTTKELANLNTKGAPKTESAGLGPVPAVANTASQAVSQSGR